MSAAELPAVAVLADAEAAKRTSSDAVVAAEHRLDILTGKLAAGESAAVDASRAQVLGEVVTEAPAPEELAAWRLEQAGLEAAVTQLRSKQERAVQAVETAKRMLAAEAHAALKTKARPAALERYRVAMDQLHEAFIGLMATDGLLNQRYPDPTRRHAPDFVSAEDVFGPGALVMTTMLRHAWPEYPYETRPAWAPKNGNQRAFQHPAVADAQKRLIAELGL